MTGRQVFGRADIRVEATIRACVEEDLPALEWMGLYTPHRAIIRQAFRAQERGDALLLLAISAGFPIGQVWIDFARKRRQRAAVLWAVRTFYPLQGSGLGRQMMEAAESALLKRGIRRAELGVERRNSGALRFYRRLGWRVERPLRETFEVRRPDGTATVTTLDEWLLVKNLRPN